MKDRMEPWSFVLRSSAGREENGGTEEKEIQIAERPTSFPRSFENAAGDRVSPVPGTRIAPSCLSGMRNI